MCTSEITTYICNDCHLVAINAELLYPLRTAIDQPQAVLLSRLECELGDTSIRRAVSGAIRAWVIHLAVDEIVVRCGRKPTLGGWSHDLLNEIKVTGMIPIIQQDWAKIDVVSVRFGAVDDHWTKSTAHILGAVMAVVERRAVKVGLEAVRVGRSIKRNMRSVNAFTARACLLFTHPGGIGHC